VLEFDLRETAAVNKVLSNLILLHLFSASEHTHTHTNRVKCTQIFILFTNTFNVQFFQVPPLILIGFTPTAREPQFLLFFTVVVAVAIVVFAVDMFLYHIIM